MSQSLRAVAGLANKWPMVRQLISDFGFGWLVARVAYEMQSRSGYQRLRFRQRVWADNELAHWLLPGIPSEPIGYATFRRNHSPNFFFQSSDRPLYCPVLHQLIGDEGVQTLIGQADQLKQGYFPYFFVQSGNLGFPPNWHTNPFTNQRTSSGKHWSQIPMFSSETGDLKFIWEPGRFASAYLLARAYWVSGNDIYAETFWRLIESWAEANPPNQGAHWRCGQEISLRLMAWCFALYAFADAPATTPERLTLIASMIATQASRVANDHLYAHLQRNNHAISEGVGLWTVGLLFPELKAAQKWRETGRRILEEEAKRQIYKDGAYVQHSTNYHRLMLQDYLWAIRLGELNGYSLSPSLQDRVCQAAALLHQLQDDHSGCVPNYGANDGALILPLNNCDYKDFRPVLGTLHYLLNGTRLYDHGPWDEDLLWIFGPHALGAKPEAPIRESWQAPIGGYYTLRGGSSWGMIRCTTFLDRPSQADMLHLDIWRQGVNVACDPGTYLYYASPPWNNSLVTTAVHNTVSVDGVDQMQRGPRFMWMGWLKSEAAHYHSSQAGELVYFEGSHNGYARLPDPVIHRRAVLKADEDIWIIVDDLIGQSTHHISLHWLLADLPFVVDEVKQHIGLTLGEDGYGLTMYRCLPNEAEQARFDVIRGTEDSAPLGWQSSYYGVRKPALSVTFSLRTATPCRLVSIFAPESPETSLHVSPKQVRFESSNLNLAASLSDPESVSIIHNIAIEKSDYSEHLTID